ncbi:hypothetical protein LCGC14_2375740 [marine sediment metagenome]|uniref:Uncharacterized protein n=1 Tax=marine sediment metagenome TaxID=412755 RepID=A0A0F9C2J1_9ZZZZ
MVTKVKTSDIAVVAKWKEASIEGDFACPLCRELMVVMVVGIALVGFCLNCRKYFVEEGNNG